LGHSLPPLCSPLAVILGTCFFFPLDIVPRVLGFLSVRQPRSNWMVFFLFPTDGHRFAEKSVCPLSPTGSFLPFASLPFSFFGSFFPPRGIKDNLWPFLRLPYLFVGFPLKQPTLTISLFSCFFPPPHDPPASLTPPCCASPFPKSWPGPLILFFYYLSNSHHVCVPNFFTLPRYPLLLCAYLSPPLSLLSGGLSLPLFPLFFPA